MRSGVLAAVGIWALGVVSAIIIVCACCCCYWLMVCVRQCGRGVGFYVKGWYIGLGLAWLHGQEIRI